MSALDHARAPAAISRLLSAGAEQSREFRKRMHELEGEGKASAKTFDSPKKAAAGSGAQQSGSQSARASHHPTERAGQASSRGNASKTPRHPTPRQRRGAAGRGSLTRGLVSTANQIDEATVAREASARIIQQRFRTRHSTGNRPEARLFEMLKQVQETLPNHHL